jgi:hypothetical protein
MKTLREILGKPVLFHTVFFHGKDGLASSRTGYLSNDPDVIGDQLTAIQEVGGEGCGMVALTYGPTVSPFIHSGCMEASRQCEERNMPFALCYDPWTVKAGANAAAKVMLMQNALKHVDTQTMMNSRSYVKSINGITGKLVLDFDLGITPSLVTSAVPGITYWRMNVDYSWPQIPGPTNNKTQLPCLCVQFDDGTGADRNKQAWNQSLPVRLLSSNGGAYYRSLVAGANPAAQFYQFATFNDVYEKTDYESYMRMLIG